MCGAGAARWWWGVVFVRVCVTRRRRRTCAARGDSLVCDLTVLRVRRRGLRGVRSSRHFLYQLLFLFERDARQRTHSHTYRTYTSTLLCPCQSIKQPPLRHHRIDPAYLLCRQLHRHRKQRLSPVMLSSVRRGRPSLATTATPFPLMLWCMAKPHPQYDPKH